ncbi:hypothetical protein [Paraburkholderia sp. C35]|uniref:hypothetical protein n=1 Tax=Paraburkholderia sp. C35 TaxID=2126993 RepID=UPI0013A58E6D|nr:hypothetical protein [Paraburkholderia sp. C35]
MAEALYRASGFVHRVFAVVEDCIVKDSNRVSIGHGDFFSLMICSPHARAQWAIILGGKQSALAGARFLLQARMLLKPATGGVVGHAYIARALNV